MRNYIFFVLLAFVSWPITAKALSLSEAKLAVSDCKLLSSGVSFSARTGFVCVKGDITKGLQVDFEKRLAAVRALGLYPKVIVIESGGGDLEAALEMAHAMGDSRMSIIVPGICASSCAEVLFIAAEKKFLMKNSLVLFHGVPPSIEEIKLLDTTDTDKNNLIKVNADFYLLYKKMRVSRDIFSPPQKVKELIKSGGAQMWSWRADQLVAFGVKDIYTESDNNFVEVRHP